MAEGSSSLLGTGFSAGTEVSAIVSALILVYVAYGTVRYFYPDFSLTNLLAETIGLR